MNAWVWLSAFSAGATAYALSGQAADVDGPLALLAGGIGLLAQLPGQRSRGEFFTAGLRFASLVLLGVLLFSGWSAEGLGPLQISFGGELLSMGLGLFGVGAAEVRDGVVLGGGRLVVLDTVKLALLPLGLAVLGFSLDGRVRRHRGAASLALAATAVALICAALRFLVLCLLSLRVDGDVLAVGRSEFVVGLFVDPRMVALSFLGLWPIAHLLCDALLRWPIRGRSSQGSPSVGGPGKSEVEAAPLGGGPRGSLLCLSALLVAGTVGVGLADHSSALRGREGAQGSALRVLIEDAHSEAWSSASVPLDRETSGREAVYSYSGLVEWLGQAHAVQVHGKGRLDADLLGEADVLLLKPAPEGFAEEERDSIEEFVREGGGLFVLGDHTNLLGSSTSLNQLLDFTGIRLNSDACNRLSDGGTVLWENPGWVRHPILDSVRELSFLTSCTLELSENARPLIVAGNSFSERADYAGSSFFGDVIPGLAEGLGPNVLAATEAIGKGRVLVVGDSTFLSTFCLTHGDAELLVAQGMEWLCAEQSARGTSVPQKGALELGWAIDEAHSTGLRWGLLAACVLCVALVAPSARWLLAILCVSGLPFWSRPEAVVSDPLTSPTRQLAVIAGDEGCHFPVPVLPDMCAPELAFDSLYVECLRAGWIPDVGGWERVDADLCNQALIVRPSKEELIGERVRIERFLEAGGRLLLVGASIDSLLQEWATPQWVESKAYNEGLRLWSVGTGRLAFTDDSDGLSAAELGDAFTRIQPGSPTERSYLNVRRVLDQAFGVPAADGSDL